MSDEKRREAERAGRAEAERLDAEQRDLDRRRAEAVAAAKRERLINQGPPRPEAPEAVARAAGARGDLLSVEDVDVGRPDRPRIVQRARFTGEVWHVRGERAERVE